MNEFQQAYKVWSDNENDQYDEYTLYHEAGHAIINSIFTGLTYGIKIDDENACGIAYTSPHIISFQGPLIAMWVDIAGLAAGKIHDPVQHKSIPFDRCFSDIGAACTNAEKLGIQEDQLESYFYQQLDECVEFLSKPEVWQMVERVVSEIKRQLVKKDFPSKLSISKTTMERILRPYENTILGLIKQGYKRNLMPHIDWSEAYPNDQPSSS